MTIDETIEFAEEQAKWMTKYSSIDIYRDKADYYRQLAEWLKELKKLRAEQREVYENGYKEGHADGYEEGYAEAYEEVNADAEEATE